MKRSDVLRLREQVWFEPVPEKLPGLEVAIVPSEAALAASDDEIHGLHVCRQAFVDFRGYMEENGEPVKNSLTARRELYSVWAIREAIRGRLLAENTRIVAGENGAGSV